ncbi:MAG: hypothetical protein Kow0081_3910 [Candidatus Dojkabacteria bacterium]
MKNFFSKTFAQFNDNLKNVAFEGFGFSVILIIILLILTVNIIQVFQKAEYNNRIFAAETELLLEARERNKKLRDTLDYLQTDEYLRLRARDVYGLGVNEERLFRPAEDISFVNVQKELLDISEKNEFADWWGYLF